MKVIKILVVEDHPLNRKLFHALLEDRGHEIVEATNVEEARLRLAGSRPDLVLLDVIIPGGGGELVLRDIRLSPNLASLPVIAVTALAMPGDRERLLAKGFDAYISKPIDTVTFGQTVESIVRQRRPDAED